MAACRDAKPDCVLLGELMHGDYNTHVGPGLLDSGDQLSAVQGAVVLSTTTTTGSWRTRTAAIRDMYGALTMLNFLGNHDQMRIHSRLNNPSAHYPLAAASMILGRGVPCLYYGDELGEQGKPGAPEGDLAMRRAIDLRDALANQSAKDAARRTAELVALRRSHEALRDADADQVPLAHTNETMAFGEGRARRRVGRRRLQQLG